MYPSEKKPYFGTFVYEQVRCLKELGINLKLVGDRGEGKKGVGVLLKYISILYRSIKAAILFKPQVIHAHYIFPTGLIALIASILSGSKLVITSHGSDVFKMARINYVTRTLTKLCLAMSNKIIAVSSEIKNAMVHDYHLQEKKIEIIDMGVSFFYHQPMISDLNLQNSINQRTNGIIKIAFIATDFELKGGYLILDAMEEIVKNPEYNNIQYIFIGENPELAKHIVETRKLNDYVEFSGYLKHSDTLNKLRNCDIFLLPSKREGLPISMLEAMSFGLSVIATPVGAIPDVIDHDYDGIIVDKIDKSRLNNALRKLMADPELRKTIGMNAIVKSRTYASEKKAKQVKKIYMELTDLR